MKNQNPNLQEIPESHRPVVLTEEERQLLRSPETDRAIQKDTERLREWEARSRARMRDYVCRS